MLRLLFVLIIAATGLAYAFQGAFYGLLFYLWVAYFRPEQWVWDGKLIYALNLSLVAGLCVTIGACLSHTRWRVNLRVAFLGLFLVQSLISVIFALNFNYAWPFWIEFAKTIVITYLIVVLTTDASRFRTVLWTIGLSLGFEATKQGWATLILAPGARNDNPLPMLGDNNGVAVGMMMLVPILMTLADTCAKKMPRLIYRFMAVGVLYRGLSTYSRGAFLACAALVTVYLVRSKRTVVAALVVIITAILITPALPDTFWQRMETIKTPNQVGEDDVSALGRLHFWSIATAMADDRPFIGIGHNSFNVVYDKYDSSHGVFGTAKSVHSTWFGVLAELGYPGLLLFIAQLILAFRACSRARRAARVNSAARDLAQYAFAVEAALVAFAVGGTFLPSQYIEILWHTIGLSIALDTLARAAIAAAPNGTAVVGTSPTQRGHAAA